MAIFQTQAAKGQQAAPSAYQSGIVTSAVFTYTFNDAYTAATDVIELGVLPADCQILGATVIGTGLGANTANIGLMTGTPSDDAGTRTVSADLFSAVSVNDNEANATLADCLDVAVSNEHRAIGATISANVAAGAAKTLTVRIEYAA
ncbi:hypothetical protein RAZWK3B_16700 [Roseobacter sp. AzwK-3b]|uniref:hypothetical protein n=1 Tax=Roseobacter sp. AzwK-3b TaxID=351016 RepID=UPI000156988C|nr:hypothetical protein [Roseobacter sp. AzwK-3b]EDM71055.1 hypothetical protein RAZWK3B_16700 [Roseobacter sp. AzwK-3b]